MLRNILLTVFLLLAGCCGLFAETAVNTVNSKDEGPRTVSSVDQYLGELKASADPAKVLELNRLERLLSGMLPVLVMRGGKVVRSTSNVALVDTDVNSLDILDSLLQGKANPEMLLIRIDRAEEMLTNHNMYQKTFDKLKYVLYLCSFKPCEAPGCESALLIRMVPGNADPAPVLLYRVSVAN